MPGANGKHGKTLDHSYGKTAGLLGALANLLRSIRKQGIRAVSSTAALELVGLI
jgi:hypothetical protein